MNNSVEYFISPDFVQYTSPVIIERGNVEIKNSLFEDNSNAIGKFLILLKLYINKFFKILGLSAAIYFV